MCSKPLSFNYRIFMLKTYKSNRGTLFLSVVVNGVNRRIGFETNGCNYAESFYTTKDVEMQKALEALPSYGKKFFVHKEYKVAATEDCPLRLVKVKSWQEASALLQTEYGVDGRRVKTPEAIRAEGKRVGIEFCIEDKV